ncbi:MAG: hypothetical protein ABEH81_11920 [Halopenitus sp.]
MRSRDLGLGLLLTTGAAWLLVRVPSVREQLPLLLAVGCCLLAGLVYLGGGLARQFDWQPAGVRLSVPVVRILTRALLGFAILTIGLDSLLQAQTITAGVITAVGVLVLGMNAARWRLRRKRSQ